MVGYDLCKVTLMPKDHVVKGTGSEGARILQQVELRSFKGAQ
jgi:hypothetical protein